ncbi:MAG: hypothetical protein WAX89_01920 [Alphaproteobacteria bacterium]
MKMSKILKVDYMFPLAMCLTGLGVYYWEHIPQQRNAEKAVQLAATHTKVYTSPRRLNVERNIKQKGEELTGTVFGVLSSIKAVYTQPEAVVVIEDVWIRLACPNEGWAQVEELRDREYFVTCLQ